jgi:hypothetical protein
MMTRYVYEASAAGIIRHECVGESEQSFTILRGGQKRTLRKETKYGFVMDDFEEARARWIADRGAHIEELEAALDRTRAKIQTAHSWRADGLAWRA